MDREIKIYCLGRYFDCSLDYLMKDELDDDNDRTFVSAEISVRVLGFFVSNMIGAVLFFGNVTIRKRLICLLCSSLESSELFLRFADRAGKELLLPAYRHSPEYQLPQTAYQDFYFAFWQGSNPF